MKFLFRPSKVKEASDRTITELDLLKIDLEKLKKKFLNGHYKNGEYVLDAESAIIVRKEHK